MAEFPCRSPGCGKVLDTEKGRKGHAPSGVNKGQPSGKTRSADRLPPRKSPSSDTSLSSALPDEGLPTEYPPRDHHQVPTTQPKSKPAEYNGPPSNVDVGDHSSVPSPRSESKGGDQPMDEKDVQGLINKAIDERSEKEARRK